MIPKHVIERWVWSGVSPDEIARRQASYQRSLLARHHGGGRKRKHKVPPLDELTRLNEKMRVSKLAEYYQASCTTVYTWFRMYGVVPKTHVLHCPEDLVEKNKTMSIKELAKYYQVSQWTVYNWFRKSGNQWVKH